MFREQQLPAGRVPNRQPGMQQRPNGAFAAHNIEPLHPLRRVLGGHLRHRMPVARGHRRPPDREARLDVLQPGPERSERGAGGPRPSDQRLPQLGAESGPLQSVGEAGAGVEAEPRSEQGAVVCYHERYEVADNYDHRVVLYWGGEERCALCAAAAERGLPDLWRESE